MDRWNLPGPPGFIGFDPQKPVRIYQRDLPHWRQEGVTYFTTFRLADSLPEERLRELAALRKQWEQQHPPPRSETDWKKLSRSSLENVERWLDAGSGSCLLRELWAAEIVVQKLQHYADQKYELGAYVIMPNHVHLLVRPYSDALDPLESLEHGWKAFSARELNAARKTTGALWQPESYDSIVRHEEHLWHCLQYVGANPRRAGLSLPAICRWVNPTWVKAGWNFRDD